MVTAMCGIQLIDRNRPEDLILMLVLNDEVDQLAMQTLSVFIGMCCGGSMVISSEGHWS